MTHQPFSFYQNPNNASGSSFNVKRKLGADDSDDESQPQPMRVRSPPLKRRATFPAPAQVPDLMTDYSNSASDEDMGMDQDMEGDNGMESPVMSACLDGDGRGFVPHYDYEYGMSGSGGIGFGPGAEEDGAMSEDDMSPNKTYPSLTPHTNPNHFSNIPPYTSSAALNLPGQNTGRSSSPLSAQPFTTSLRGPSPVRGLMQPTSAEPLPHNASDVDKARAIHSSNCKSIPRLIISPHADPSSGKQPMYTMCPDCGQCERIA